MTATTKQIRDALACTSPNPVINQITGIWRQHLSDLCERNDLLVAAAEENGRRLERATDLLNQQAETIQNLQREREAQERRAEENWRLRDAEFERAEGNWRALDKILKAIDGPGGWAEQVQTLERLISEKQTEIDRLQRENHQQGLVIAEYANQQGTIPAGQLQPKRDYVHQSAPTPESISLNTQRLDRLNRLLNEANQELATLRNQIIGGIEWNAYQPCWLCGHRVQSHAQESLATAAGVDRYRCRAEPDCDCAANPTLRRNSLLETQSPISAPVSTETHLHHLLHMTSALYDANLKFSRDLATKTTRVDQIEDIVQDLIDWSRRSARLTSRPETDQAQIPTVILS